MCRTSCGGMSKVMVRMSTLIKLSVHGKMKNSPAPKNHKKRKQFKQRLKPL